MSSDTAPSPKVIFHIGLHKTGTTWLQQRVFSPENARSIQYSDQRMLLRGVFSKPRHDAFSAEAARAALTPLLQEAGQAGRITILSDEALAGFPFGDRFRQAVTLERIAATFPEAGLLITIREQTRILHSVYGHYLRGGGTASLKNFLRQPPENMAATWDPVVDLDYYDYMKLLRYCRTLFDPDRVVMVPMEWMLQNPVGLFERLSQAFGLDWSHRPLPDTQTVVNPAWSDIGYTVARTLNHLKTGQPRWAMKTWRLKPNGMADRMDKLTPKALRVRHKARQLDTIEQAIGERYAGSNSALSKALDLDLAQYNYRTQ